MSIFLKKRFKKNRYNSCNYNLNIILHQLFYLRYSMGGTK